MASPEPDTDSASSPTQNTSSSSEFHENIVTKRENGRSVPPDFIPIRSSWRSSSLMTREEYENHEEEEEESPSVENPSLRGDAGSMKESKTFSFGLKHFTEGGGGDASVKGRYRYHLLYDNLSMHD